MHKAARSSSDSQDSSPPQLPPGSSGQVAPLGSGTRGCEACGRPRPGAGAGALNLGPLPSWLPSPPCSSQCGPHSGHSGLAGPHVFYFCLGGRCSTRGRSLRQVGQVGPGGECCRPCLPLGFWLSDSRTAKENRQPWLGCTCCSSLVSWRGGRGRGRVLNPLEVYLCKQGKESLVLVTLFIYLI